MVVASADLLKHVNCLASRTHLVSCEQVACAINGVVHNSVRLVPGEYVNKGF
jgi:hypothetical protein